MMQISPPQTERIDDCGPGPILIHGFSRYERPPLRCTECETARGRPSLPISRGGDSIGGWTAPPGKVLFVFVDGVGIGEPDPRVNLLAGFETKILGVFSGRETVLPRQGLGLVSDPAMGVDGLPQSATGQAALFTGINTAGMLGRHLSGFPNRKLKELVKQHSILKRLGEKGRKVGFVNTYTTEYLANIYPEREAGIPVIKNFSSGTRIPGRKSVTTVMNEAAGLRFRTEKDLLENNGLHMDFSNRFLRSQGYRVPLRTPAEAADILVNLARGYDLSVYEFFFSDLAGHRGNLEEAVQLLKELDNFLFEVVSRLNMSELSLVITSDHGNIEDMSTRTHTGNLVPLLVWGEIRKYFQAGFDPVPITEITPLILNYLGAEG